MRLYSPEWDALRDYAYTPRFKDVQFDLTPGSEIPADHGYSLFKALSSALPWLVGSDVVGVLPVHGAPTGRNDNLLINRRVKLTLRVPVVRLDDIQSLVGMQIDAGAGAFSIGDAHVKPLIPFATLYSPFVINGVLDELEFLQAIRGELEKMTVRCGLIPGKQRKMRLPEGEQIGYSLMLHDVGPEHSLLIQEQGLGRYHGYGCGLFVPHKSIKEVAID